MTIFLELFQCNILVHVIPSFNIETCTAIPSHENAIKNVLDTGYLPWFFWDVKALRLFKVLVNISCI